MAVSVAVEVKPEVEIWRQSKNQLLTQISYSLLQTVLAKTYHFATIQNVTDRQTTDRQTTQCAKDSTNSTVGQKNGCYSSPNGKYM